MGGWVIVHMFGSNHVLAQVLVIKSTKDFDEIAPRHHLMLMEW